MDSKKIVVALDGLSRKEAIRIAQTLKGLVWGFKLNDMVYKDLSLITDLKKYGKIFIDVKLHDIPNTVANSVNNISKLGADIITVHAIGGIQMMKQAFKNSGRSKIIAVTVLTSNKTKNSNDVVSLAKDAAQAGLDGLVCSGHELEALSRLQSLKKMLKVVPGLRPAWYKTKDDQVRTMTPKQALELGADLLVIGRPITKSRNILRDLDRMFRE